MTTLTVPARRVWLVPFIATLLSMTALQMSNLGFSPLLPAIQNEFGMSFSQLGLFTGMYGLLAIAMSVPAGLAAKRFGEKHTLIGGLLVVSVGLVCLSLAHTFAEALVWRGLWITGYRFAFVCVMTAIALTCPPSLKGRSMGLVGATSAMASVIGAPVGGLLVRDFGWRFGILWYVAAALAGAAVLAMFYRRTHADLDVQDPHAIGAPVSSHSSRSAFRTPLVWTLALLLGIGGVGQFSVTFFVPSIARSVYGLDAASAGFIISAGYLGAIVVGLVIGALMDRFDKWRVLGLIFVVLMVASATLASTPSLPVFRIATAITLACGFTAINQLYGVAGDVMRGRETANVMGVVSLGAGLFGYFGPQMLGALRDWTGGFAAGFYLVAGADAVTLLLIVWLRRYASRASV